MDAGLIVIICIWSVAILIFFVLVFSGEYRTRRPHDTVKQPRPEVNEKIEDEEYYLEDCERKGNWTKVIASSVGLIIAMVITDGVIDNLKDAMCISSSVNISFMYDGQEQYFCDNFGFIMPLVGIITVFGIISNVLTEFKII